MSPAGRIGFIGWLRRRWSAWVELTSTRELGTTLAWFRIAVGLVILYSLLSMIAADLVEVMWVDAEHGGLLTLSTRHWLVPLLGGRTASTAWTLVGSGLLLATLVVLGLGGRLVILATLQVYYALTTASPVLTGGYDTMITNALWLLLLARSTATLSADCWIRTRRLRSDELVPAWPRYLVILQLVVIYTTTGLHKLSPTWTPGGDCSALYWVFQEPTWRRFDMSWTASAFPLMQLMTAVTWWWEVLAPLLLLVYWARATAERGGWLRRVLNRHDLRKVWATIGVGLHLGILVSINVGPFSLISLAFYLCLIPPRAPPTA
ncbi:HTTM domain-containing protein [Paraliomyxa miuraensis]|uniref:HTTM domain-containing protein n=1 Tax=Paraliomyxa miuraensis TaxID=376150 RepID=UPI0022587FB9|nr:HTTM domain-containing protein [Paraliomyxa miuraensis]MCX4240613.1 HTTM domain-containing protein [Paraliomyxa miuraensis]